MVSLPAPGSKYTPWLRAFSVSSPSLPWSEYRLLNGSSASPPVSVSALLVPPALSIEISVSVLPKPSVAVPVPRSTTTPFVPPLIASRL